jgi:hypothetical protein
MTNKSSNLNPDVVALIEPIGSPKFIKICIRAMFIDIPNQLHKRIFKEHKIHFIPTRVRQNDEGYILNKGIILFPNFAELEKAITIIEKNALILGYSNYHDECQRVIKILEQIAHKKEGKNNAE